MTSPLFFCLKIPPFHSFRRVWADKARHHFRLFRCFRHCSILSPMIFS